jgi:hypothetical protein
MTSTSRLAEADAGSPQQDEGHPTEPHATIPRRLAGWLTACPVVAVVSVYLMATGRWGSYVTVPSANFYIGDIAVGLAFAQVVLAVATGRASPRDLRRSPLILLMVLALLAYTIVRLAVQLEISAIGLRDVAPYAYAVVAVLAFLLPARDEPYWRPIIYAALVFHLLWAVALKEFPGYPWHLPVLGTDAQIFGIRPDFDATVMGIGAAFALWDLMVRRGLGWPTRVALVVFIAASVFGLVDVSTRAGLLAGLSGLLAVALTSHHRSSRRERRSPITRTRLVALVVAGIIAVSVLALTPAGSRLVDGFGNGAGAGTISAREAVWERVGTYVFRDPERTAIGIGFGRDFIEESGSAAFLEGTYQNVRSPHNYVVGTMARLGVAGALIVSLIIGLGWWLSVSTLLRPDTSAVDVLAALLVIGIPIAALLGVVLESPFGAIPYFWALGQLAAFAVASLSARERTAVTVPSSSSET